MGRAGAPRTRSFRAAERVGAPRTRSSWEAAGGGGAPPWSRGAEAEERVEASGGLSGEARRRRRGGHARSMGRLGAWARRTEFDRATAQETAGLHAPFEGQPRAPPTRTPAFGA